MLNWNFLYVSSSSLSSNTFSWVALSNNLKSSGFSISKEFEFLRNEFEKVYSKTRVINKSENYILDQDHHRHTANQSINMDWQFIGELKLFEKLNLTYK